MIIAWNWTLVRLTFFALIGLFWASTPVFTLADSDAPVWSTKQLVGKANTHPGPDCHNATLVAKGYEDEIATTSSEQMNFYLERFCRKSQSPMKTGDIVAVFDVSGDLAHTLYAMNDVEVFEKESGDGLLQNNSHMSPYYQIKKLSESWYFMNREKNKYRFVIYGCLEAPLVREQLKMCERRSEELGVKSIRRAFEKMAFSTSGEFHLDEQALFTMGVFANALEQIKRPDPCLDYFRVMVKSISASIGSLEAIGGKTTSQAWRECSQRQAWLRELDHLSLGLATAEANVSYFKSTGHEPYH